jgi:phosphoglycolate phosphatase-like HAD superfamily hydrolase
MRASSAAEGAVLPGVAEALTAVSEERDWVSTVLTGNIAANARLKLSVFCLNQLLDLPVGAYGADAEQRPALVAVARKRVYCGRGLPDDAPVVLVGDTPRDVEAALTTGSAIIAVSTGIYSPVELAAARAPVVLRDLSDTPAVLAALRSIAGE